MTSANTRRALTITQFQEAYGVGRTTTYGEIKAGRLKVARVGSKPLIPVDAAEQWLSDRQREADELRPAA